MGENIAHARCFKQKLFVHLYDSLYCNVET